METKTPQPPSFTVSLRGYDREEVDDYIDSLAEALGQVDLAKEQNRRLHAHIDRLTARIKELEERISSDTPRTAGLAAERIAILLRAAEDTAADTVNRAEATAAQIVSEAQGKLVEAEEAMRGAVARGEAQARSIEAGARSEAAEIVAEAERRAAARTRQIEQWAEEVVSRTRAEEARMLREHQQRREGLEAELTALAERRDEAAAVVRALHETLGKALGLVAEQPAGQGGQDGDTAHGSTTSRPGAGQVEAGSAAPESVKTNCRARDEATTVDAGRTVDTGRSPSTEESGTSRSTLEWANPGGHEEEVATPSGEGERAAAGPYDAEAVDTGELEAARAGAAPAGRHDDPDPGTDTDDTDAEFEAKLEAWVSEGSESERN
jgi:DivIVA domain-containing protein